MKKGNLVIAIYSPPEYYPPTLNAIECLSDEFKNIAIVFRNYSGKFDWEYPHGVRVLPVGKYIDVRKGENSSYARKIFYFLQYTKKLLTTVRKEDPEIIILYDYMPILSIRLIWYFIKKPKILWYHNHDVGDRSLLRKGSISWFAWKSEKWIFPKLSFFSLPALERRPYFPFETLKGKFFYLPNYPSRKVIRRFKLQPKELSGEVKLIFQGSIGPLHGFEEIIGILNEEIDGRLLKLILKGSISDIYKGSLIKIAEKYGVSDRMVFLPQISYSNVIRDAKNYHIGIGIYMKEDIMNRTMATSSNKIYEYAAAGLPVLLYDNIHFRSHLDRYSWAFFTDCSANSLKMSIKNIIQNYTQYSFQAMTDFEKELNFENFFLPLVNFLKG